MDDTYAEVGTEVVIGFGNKYNYTGSMLVLRYTKTIIIRVYRFSFGIWCDTANSINMWPVDDMILVSDIDLLSLEQKALIKDHNGKNNPLL